MSTTAKPYLFSDVPRLTKAENELSNSLYAYLGLPASEARLAEALAASLRELTRLEVSLSLSNVAFVEIDQYRASLAPSACTATFSVLPKAGSFFVDLDAAFAKEIVYRVLGKDAVPSDAEVALSDVEQGVFSFVLLKLLTQVQSQFDPTAFGQFQLLTSPMEEPTRLAMLNFAIQFDGQTSYVRLGLSDALVHSLASSFQKDEADGNVLADRSIRRCAALGIPIVVEVGHVSLQPNDVTQLEVDDIIVLEGSHVQLKEPGLVGEVRCRIGNEEYGSFQGRLLLNKNGRYAVSTGQIIAASEPPANATVQTNNS